MNGIEEKKANAIFDLLEKFAGYGFNKSHSAAYGLISYRTAFLKANYPVEFMAGLLSNEVNNTEKISVFVAECQRLGISILPPDVNQSHLKFVPETAGDRRAIRYGLAAIKNIGESAMDAAISERLAHGPYKSMEDYCSRLDSRSVNRKILENLIRAGAFDFTGRDRAELFARIDLALSSGASAQRDRMSGQVSLFGDLELESAPVRIGEAVNFTPWSLAEKLGYEKDLLGFYVTGHPLDSYRTQLEQGSYLPIGELQAKDDKAAVQIAGSIVAVDRKFTKKEGKPFAIVSLEDFTGQVEILIWGEVYTSAAREIEKSRIVSVKARLDRKEDGVRLVANEIGSIAPDKSSRPLTIDLPADQLDERRLEGIRELIRQFPGEQPLFLRFISPFGEKVKLRTAREFSVKDSPLFRERLAGILQSAAEAL